MAEAGEGVIWWDSEHGSGLVDSAIDASHLQARMDWVLVPRSILRAEKPSGLNCGDMDRAARRVDGPILPRLAVDHRKGGDPMVYREHGYGWHAWRWIAWHPGGATLSPSFGCRMDAEADVRHLRPWGPA